MGKMKAIYTEAQEAIKAVMDAEGDVPETIENLEELGWLSPTAAKALLSQVVSKMIGATVRITSHDTSVDTLAHLVNHGMFGLLDDDASRELALHVIDNAVHAPLGTIVADRDNGESNYQTFVDGVLGAGVATVDIDTIAEAWSTPVSEAMVGDSDMRSKLSEAAHRAVSAAHEAAEVAAYNDMMGGIEDMLAAKAEGGDNK